MANNFANEKQRVVGQFTDFAGQGHYIYCEVIIFTIFFHLAYSFSKMEPTHFQRWNCAPPTVSSFPMSLTTFPITEKVL
jgi:hypothetical protein